ncbi:hypothetical protein B0675_33580 [Streptomyces sp. M41(2017)]|uniref:DUF4232 domain-containing protein n=1 Tax=Streptomyces sp. M41(2017) TaxID=1955065 RepID=UPI0009BE59B6|nr:DUF4232 domain-containing protein [Streptomyces sp. M41(2017)]OQQ15004.1 hypothetical protein B0675_33580 [Streptomyces sp. M41(2017)]
MLVHRRSALIAATATLLVGAAGIGTAQASSPSALAAGAAPSACRPANHTARITAGPATAGHRHYRVTLTAARGYEPCRLAGSPADVRFHQHGSLRGVTPGRYGSQRAVVTFGPGRPVHFDIQVPVGPGGVRADRATFTLRAPDGVIPGESSASGRLVVAAGTAVGPVRPGA